MSSAAGPTPVATGDDRWLIAIDIDGTLVHDNGYLSPRGVSEVERVRALGHEIIVATGRSASNAIPVVDSVGIKHGYSVCSNGAVTIEVDPAHPAYIQTVWGYGYVFVPDGVPVAPG